MEFERARGAARLALAMSALLALIAFLAGSYHPTPQAWVLYALIAVPTLYTLLRASHMLVDASRIKPEEISPAAPRDRQLQLDRLTALEATLEHAPIALFDIAADRNVLPVNAYARRLVAPGRVIDAGHFCIRLEALPSGQRNMVTYDTERGQERALAAVGAMTLQGQPRRLVALMTIESELENAALRAWQQLVHVLTHEIMNSLTPVASLSHTARYLLDEWRNDPASDADTDLATALDAIGRRADSLVTFVANYRSLSNMQPAQPERIRLSDLFNRLAALSMPSWQARGGSVGFTVEPSTLELMADAGQVEQALINLLQNAAEATAHSSTAQVSITARLGRGGRLLIEVQDNGPGVPENLIEHIFTPFYSTTPRGSGIGLAMVRQLVHGNGGTVRYIKPAAGGARFVLTF